MHSATWRQLQLAETWQEDSAILINEKVQSETVTGNASLLQQPDDPFCQ